MIARILLSADLGPNHCQVGAILLWQSMSTVEPTMTVLSIARVEIDSGRKVRTTRMGNKDDIFGDILRRQSTAFDLRSDNVDKTNATSA